MKKKYDFLVIGGGAAGFFTAINVAERNPQLKIGILEAGRKVLTKVKVSGGGRCNVTHACWTPRELVKFYPRGHKELLGPFSKFCCGDTFEWFEKWGVNLNIEADGRCFPDTNDSQTIIDCFLNIARRHKIDILTQQKVQNFKLNDAKNWQINTSTHHFTTKKLLVATGSNKLMWEFLQKMGHTIVPPVPSLFSFKIPNSDLTTLPGLSVQKVQVKIADAKITDEGAVLITHQGVSGPGVLKISAWGARKLNDLTYNFPLKLNWLYPENTETIRGFFNDKKQNSPKQKITKSPFPVLSRRLWEHFLIKSDVDSSKNYADLSKKDINKLATSLTQDTYDVSGKNTNKDEFVTAGGVALNEVDFSDFSSKVLPNLHFAGEVLNIDAVTGGFNFQACWTGGFVIGERI